LPPRVLGAKFVGLRPLAGCLGLNRVGAGHRPTRTANAGYNAVGYVDETERCWMFPRCRPRFPDGLVRAMRLRAVVEKPRAAAAMLRPQTDPARSTRRQAFIVRRHR
jgi:hypothetical protein